LSDLVGRADRALPRLEARLAEEQAATDRAARLTADIEERLKLGVRMLQAFDVQTSRGESIANRAVQAIEEVERVLAEAALTSRAELQADADRLATSKIDEISRDLDAQRERFRQFESSAELLAKEKLERVQTELDAQLARLNRADLDATALASLDQLGNDGQAPSVVWRERFEAWNKTWINRGLTALFAALPAPLRCWAWLA
jgi:hypothetical protein